MYKFNLSLRYTAQDIIYLTLKVYFQKQITFMYKLNFVLLAS